MDETKLCQFCGKSTIYAKGFCRNCYERNRLHGSPEHKRGKPGERVKAVLDVYRTSRSYTNAAKELNVSRQYVQQVVHKYYKPTNADRIRAMSDEEIAGTMVTGCPPSDSVREMMMPECTEDGGCFKCWLDWLQSPADGS